MNLADLTTRELKRKDAKKLVDASDLPALTHYCDTARAVSMQTDWHKRGGRMAIDFSDSPLGIEIVGPKGTTLLAGRWPLQVEFNSQSQIQLDDWEEVCWYSDEEVDYLEVEAKFGDKCSFNVKWSCSEKNNLYFWPTHLSASIRATGRCSRACP